MHIQVSQRFRATRLAANWRNTVTPTHGARSRAMNSSDR